MDFDELIRLGLEQQLVGWDFGWLNEHTEEEPLPWNYREIVLDRMHENGHPGVQSMLDMETGGGEFLSSLTPFPPVTWATEGYSPNVVLARARLEPLGIHLADVSAQSEQRLPFGTESFDLVINRHGGFNANEIQRVLRPGGRFLTQQVGGQNCLDFNRALQDEVKHEYQNWSLENAINQFQGTGMRVLQSRQAFPSWTFKDIAGIVFYLKAIPWQIEDFSVETYREKLFHIHQHIEKTGGYPVREHRFLIELVK